MLQILLGWIQIRIFKLLDPDPHCGSGSDKNECGSTALPYTKVKELRVVVLSTELWLRSRSVFDRLRLPDPAPGVKLIFRIYLRLEQAISTGISIQPTVDLSKDFF